jgi:hypothetical protein
MKVLIAGATGARRHRGYRHALADLDLIKTPAWPWPQ